MTATTLVRPALLAAAAAVAFAWLPIASAGELTKEECLDAHSRGQDAKEQNKLSLARKLFLTCAQASCPQLVQGDCARFADDLSRLQPSVSFIARDGGGADLPDTTVYVDDVLIVTRLDGSVHDIDPGKHVVRFTNNGKDEVQTIVIGSGEKGRTIVATFGSPVPTPAVAAAMRADQPIHRQPKVVHPLGSRALIWGGGALGVGGAALAIVGMLKIPSNCSLSSHECAAAPGDSSLSKASSAVKLADYGIAVGTIGLAALAGGVVWYYGSAKMEKEHVAVAPWLSPGGGGIALGGEL